MSTMEKHFVGIFERKRWIIEHLKQQKLLYDQHLASKLIIQGITPPPWLINPEFPSSTLDRTAMNKEELISGLLLPQQGPLVTYPTGACFLYDNSVATAVNCQRPQATCAKTCASSNGPEGDEPSIIPSCHISNSEDGAGIVPPCHVDVSEDMFNYVPMSPEDQTDTMNPNTYLKLDESLARIHRSKSRQKALELRNSAKTSGKHCLGKENSDGISSDNKTFGYDQPHEDVRKSVQLVGFSALSTCINEEAGLGDCSNKEMRSDACGDPSSQSKGNEAMVVQRENDKKQIQSSVCVGRNTMSGSCGLQSSNGSHASGYSNTRKSHQVYIGIMTRSRSGKARLSEKDDIQNRRVTRSRSSQIQPNNGNHASGYCKVKSGRVTKSRSGGQEPENKDQRSWAKNESKDHRSRAKDMSVKPKQLDFDEFEETCLAEGKSILEEKTIDQHIEETSASLPGGEENSSFPLKLIISEGSDAILSTSGVRAVHGVKYLDSMEHELAPKVQYEEGKSSFGRSVMMPLKCDQIIRSTVSASNVTTVPSDFIPVEELREAPASTVHCVGRLSNDLELADMVGQGISTNKLSFAKSMLDKKMSLREVDTLKLSVGSPIIEHMDVDTDAGDIVPESDRFITDETNESVVNVDSGLNGEIPFLCKKAECSKLPEQIPRSVSLSTLASPFPTTQKLHFTPGVYRSVPHGLLENIDMRSDMHSSDNDLKGKSYSDYCFLGKRLGRDMTIPFISLVGEGFEGIFEENNVDHHIKETSASLPSEEENYSLPLKLSITEGSDAILSNSEFVPTAVYGVKYLSSKEHELAPKVLYEEGKGSLGRSVTMPIKCDQIRLSASSVTNVTTVPSDFIPVKEVREAPTSTVHCTERLSNDSDTAETVVQGAKTMLDKIESLQEADKLKFSIGSPLVEPMDVDTDADEIVPEFEGFIIDEKIENVVNDESRLNAEFPFLCEKAECSNLPEHIPRPVSLSTPASPFPTAYKLHFTPGVYRSVPNGLLENIDLTSNQLSGDNGLQGKSYSDYCFPGKRLGRDMTIPFISPVGKGFEGITPKSGSSGKRLSSNPELICFPIQEDPETSEEDVNADDTYDTGMHGFAPNVRNSSIRGPLCDIPAANGSMAGSHAVERGSLESVATEVSISDKHDGDSKKNEMHLRRRQTRKGKENKSLSIGVNSIKKLSESLSSRYSKPKFSGKSSLRSRGQSLSEKESERNNIVSNVKSFLPLVQPKQASSVIPAKREVKVKALEAAEAAKRLAEKRENERKQKKEALKLERARLEQENMRQMELKKKLKEEEKKKRDDENAARKRQREEEDRKEKERKRKRIEEARCQQKQAEEKISVWKEESKCESQDRREHERQNLDDKVDTVAQKQNISTNPDGLIGSDGRKVDNAMPSANDIKSSTGSSDTGKVGSIDVADVSTPNCDKSDKLISQASREQSYDISPYQCSDDEEEEEDDIPNKKFIPAWASKSCVAVTLSSLKHLDPDMIFLPGSFCSLEEVLLPRRLAQK